MKNLPTKNYEMPLYSSLWFNLRSFPGLIHRGSNNPPATSGAAAAFLISGGIGSVIMMIIHHIVDVSEDFKDLVKSFGSWIPGAISKDPMWGNIGSYAGKETAMLLGWLVSLTILYPLLKNRQVKSITMFCWLFGLYTLATVMSWHPAIPYLPLQ
jgi:hypothetical protein